MPFIGAQPATTFAKATSQVFTNANGSIVDFTLNKHVSNPEDIEVFVSNVQQQPTTSYTILSNGVTLRFSEAPPSGDFYVVYRNFAQQTGIDTGALRKNGGIADNSDATTITLDANEDITASNGMYVSGDLTSLTVDKGGIDRSGNTTRIISGRSGGNYADMSINIAGVGGVNRQVYVDYQGNMTLDNGNLTIGTAGKGIDFSAVTHATGKTSELLDAYEEGTWTPTYRTSDGSSITVTTYNRQHGRYTRIGRNVFIRFSIGTTNVSFPNGQVNANSNHRVQIDGLPFTASNDAINGGGCSAVFSTMGSVSTGVGFLINNNSTIISLRNMGDTASYNGNYIDDIYTAQMRVHSSGEGNMLTGQFFYQTE